MRYGLSMKWHNSCNRQTVVALYFLRAPKIHMLKKADIGVAMGNASDFVKSYANFATTSTYDNGIYNAVTKILKDE